MWGAPGHSIGPLSFSHKPARHIKQPSFADDTRLLRGVSKKEDSEKLQHDLDSVYSWAEDIGMVCNAGKFELLRFWPDKEVAPDNLYTAPDGS